MIVLITVSLAADKLMYQEIVHDKLALLAKQEVKKQGPQILECLLSRLLELSEQPWLVFVSGTLAITFLFSFFLHKDAQATPGCSFGFRRVFDASRALMFNERLLFRCTGATLYMIFHSSCQVNEDHGTIDGLIFAAKHVGMLDRALDIIYFACNNYNPTKDFLAEEWTLKSEKSMQCTVTDIGPTWLAWVYRKAALHEFQFLFNRVSFFVATFGPRNDKQHNTEFEEKKSRGVLVSVIFKSFLRSCDRTHNIWVKNEGINDKESTNLLKDKIRDWVNSLPKLREPDKLSMTEVEEQSIKLVRKRYQEQRSSSENFPGAAPTNVVAHLGHGEVNSAGMLSKPTSRRPEEMPKGGGASANVGTRSKRGPTERELRNGASTTALHPTVAEGELPTSMLTYFGISAAQLAPTSYSQSPSEAGGIVLDPVPFRKAAGDELAPGASRSMTELRAPDVDLQAQQVFAQQVLPQQVLAQQAPGPAERVPLLRRILLLALDHICTCRLHNVQAFITTLHHVATLVSVLPHCVRELLRLLLGHP